MALLVRLLAFTLIAVLPAYAVLAFDHGGPDFRLHVAAALVLGAVLAVLTASVSRRHFVRTPLQRLTALANALREGRYSTRAAAGEGEFAPLARAFNQMAEQLATREAALRGSEQRFRRLSDASFEGMAIHDGENIVETNAAAARLFGYKPGEVDGMPLVAFLAPEARERSLAIAHAEEERRYESVGLRKDGSTFPVEFRGRRIEHEGRPMRIVAIRDLTEQKNAAAALRESEERLKLALAAGGLGTWDLDLATGRVRLDAPLAAMLGVPPGKTEATVEEWANFVHPEDRPKMRADFAAHLDGETPHGPEYRVILADGTERWHATHAILLRREDGTPVRAVGVAQDITERKQSEARLRLLAAEVDHRSKNMLALVQVMLRQTRAETVREYAAAAQGRVAALARAHTLLSQTRWESADLGGLIKDELAPFRRTDGARVRLEGPPVALSSRAAQSFAMAIHELATNAAKHGALSMPKGSVSVEWIWREDDRLIVRWSEVGGPPVQAPTRHRLGTKVIQRSIGEQLEGEVRFDWRPEGLVCELTVPADKLTRPAR
jgi:PAS domain S-box-containing protein